MAIGAQIREFIPTPRGAAGRNSAKRPGGLLSPANGRCRARLALSAALAGLAIVFLTPGMAAAHPAHASFKSSNPAPNAILKAPPSLVTVHFVENVAPQGSDIVVYDATGKQVSTAPAQVNRSDLTTMTVPMKGTASEIYLVEWHTVSADDGDPDIGAFNFLVNPSATTIQAVTGGAHASSSKSSGGMPVLLGLLLGVIGLIVGAGATWFLAPRLRLGGSASTSARRP